MIQKLKDSLLKLFWCKLLNDHTWTSASMRGEPIKAKSEQTFAEDFCDYASIYCERCGKVSELSKKFKEDLKKNLTL